MMKQLRTFFLASILFTGIDTAFAQCSPSFYDGFESGSYTPIWTIGSGLTSAAVTTTNPASGTYRLEGTGGTTTHLTGLTTAIASATPSMISWDIFPTGTGSTNYFVAGDNSVSATNCVMFCYWLGSSNAIRFVAGSTYQLVVTPSVWHHIEMRNINWTNHTFDIYIDNVLQSTAFPFRSSTQNSITNLHLYNFNSGVGVWDNITLGTAPIALTNTTTSTTCPGGSDGAIDLSVSGGTPGYTYSWSNSATTEDLTGLAAGTYSVTVTDANTCTQTASFTITSPPTFTVTATATPLSCSGSNDGSATAVSSGGTGTYTYMWSNGWITPTITGLAGGVYTYTVTDVAGCSATQSVVVTQPAALSVAPAQSDVLCNGGSDGSATVSVSGGTGPYQYAWMPGNGTQPTASGLVTGSYTCTITDTNNCTTTQSFLITEPALLTAASSATAILCAGGMADITVTASGGTAPYTGDGTFSVTAGTYPYTVTDANGCTGTTSITVTEPPAIAVSSSVVNVSCNGGNNGSIDLTVNGGTGPFTFSWNGGAYTTEDLTGLSAGTYSGILTDANGCQDSGSVAITEPAVLAATTASSAGPSTCSGADGSIDLSVTGGTAGYTFLWNTTATTEDLSALTAGTYSVTVTDTNGCTASTTVTLSDPNPPTVTYTSGVTTLCADDASITLSGGSPAGGVYSGTAVTGGVFDPSNNVLGGNTITYSYTDPNTMCAASATAVITVNACTGIADPAAAESGFTILPNPNNGTFLLQLNAKENADARIYDALGQLLGTQQVQPGVAQQLHIETPGVYLIVVVTNDGRRSTQRVVVNK